MSEHESIIFDLDVRVSEMTKSELRQLETISYRVISMLRRMGLPEEVNSAIMRIQQLIMTIRLAHTALKALESGTTYGLFMGALTLGASAFSAYDAARGT
jgi:hypothetical protein